MGRGGEGALIKICGEGWGYDDDQLAAGRGGFGVGFSPLAGLQTSQPHATHVGNITSGSSGTGLTLGYIYRYSFVYFVLCDHC